MKILWLTDLHLDRASEEKQRRFFSRLRQENADTAVITGDISDARRLPGHLKILAQSFGARPIYFVLGNHDFYGSNLCDVDRSVSAVCGEYKNLRHLGHGEIIPLGSGAALVGHRGWADGRAGYGSRTEIPNPDRKMIADLCGLSDQAMFDKLAELGKESANYFRDVLPYSLKCYEHVWVATHVPPFTWAAFYDGKPCGRHHLPHYTNLSAGSAIYGICKQFPKSRLTVLCGHTHSATHVRASERIQVLVGEARTKYPQMQQLFISKNR